MSDQPQPEEAHYRKCDLELIVSDWLDENPTHLRARPEDAASVLHAHLTRKHRAVYTEWAFLQAREALCNQIRARQALWRRRP